MVLTFNLATIIIILYDHFTVCTGLTALGDIVVPLVIALRIGVKHRVVSLYVPCHVLGVTFFILKMSFTIEILTEIRCILSRRFIFNAHLLIDAHLFVITLDQGRLSSLIDHNAGVVLIACLSQTTFVSRVEVSVTLDARVVDQLPA